VAAALLLYGCGGSGAARDDGPAADTTAPDTTVTDSLTGDTTTADTTTAADTTAADTLAPDTTTAADTTAADSLPRADRAPADTADRPALVDADSLSAFTDDGERIQDLFGNVFVRQDSTRLRSRYARRYLERDEFLFAQNVTIFERGDTLYADTVRYDKNRKIGRARGNVRLTDGQVTVRAPRAVYYTQEKRSVFPDSVVLVDSSRVLRARAGEYFSEEKRAEFYGNVRLTDPDTYMEADSVTYLRDEEESRARGNVFIERNPRSRRAASEDTTSRTFLFGRTARNEEKRKFSHIEGNALLVRIRADSAGRPSDTLLVAAHEMEATRLDTLNRLVAIDSVRIWEPTLSAVADSAVYDRVEPRRTAEPEPTPWQPPRPDDPLLARALFPPVPDLDSLIAATRIRGGARIEDRKARIEDRESRMGGRDSLRGDSLRPDSMRTDSLRADSVGIDSLRAGGSVEGAGDEAGGDSAEDSTEEPPLEESRLYQNPVTWFKNAQVTGDSIRVLVRNRSVDTVFVRGNAFAAQQDTAVGEIQQLTGKTITATFRDEALDRIVAEPNARAIRFLAGEGEGGNGAAKPSGDRIIIEFTDGEVTRVRVLGGVQSQYYQAGSVPEPFQLEGFSWTPERKPTRDALLTPRARERLGIALTPDAPQPDSLRPDSLRPDSLRPDSLRPDTMRAAPDSLVTETVPDAAVPDAEQRPAGIDTAATAPTGAGLPDSTSTKADSVETATPPARPAPPPRNEGTRVRSDTTRRSAEETENR
jgi:lipopolysaccharide export system protein LptA